MQFKVPQDVQQADRIVWFLTLPQLIICVVGGAISYAIYAALSNQGASTIFWLPPVILTILTTVAFAFIKIANLPFHRYLALVIERFVTPSKRVWVKGTDQITQEEGYKTPEEKKEDAKAEKESQIMIAKEEQLKEIRGISKTLDTLKQEKESEPLKTVDAEKDENLLKSAFLNEKPHGDKSSKMETQTNDPEEKILEIGKKPLSEASKEIPPTEEPQKRKKKRRKRRRTKKNTESTTTQTEEKKDVSDLSKTLAPEPALPSWLSESPEKPPEPENIPKPKAEPIPKPEPVPEQKPEPIAIPKPNPVPEQKQVTEPPQAPKPAPEPIPEQNSNTDTEPKPQPLQEPELASETKRDAFEAPDQSKNPIKTPERPPLKNKNEENLLKKSEILTADQLRQGAERKVPSAESQESTT